MANVGGPSNTSIRLPATIEEATKGLDHLENMVNIVKKGKVDQSGNYALDAKAEKALTDFHDSVEWGPKLKWVIDRMLREQSSSNFPPPWIPMRGGDQPVTDPRLLEGNPRGVTMAREAAPGSLTIAPPWWPKPQDAKLEGMLEGFDVVGLADDAAHFDAKLKTWSKELQNLVGRRPADGLRDKVIERIDGVVIGLKESVVEAKRMLTRRAELIEKHSPLHNRDPHEIANTLLHRHNVTPNDSINPFGIVYGAKEAKELLGDLFKTVNNDSNLAERVLQALHRSASLDFAPVFLNAAAQKVFQKFVEKEAKIKDIDFVGLPDTPPDDWHPIYPMYGVGIRRALENPNVRNNADALRHIISMADEAVGTFGASFVNEGFEPLRARGATLSAGAQALMGADGPNARQGQVDGIVAARAEAQKILDAIPSK